MKKQKRQVVVLIILLAVCILGYVLLNRYQDKKQEEEAAEYEAEIVFETDADKITKFSYVVNGVTYHYVKSDEEWKCEEEPDLDLDENQISSLLSNLTGISCDEVLSDVEDYNTYGFDAPSNEIDFQTEDGEEYSIKIGDYNGTAYCYYYMTSLSDDIYVGNAYVCSAFTETPDYYEVVESESELSEEDAESGTN
ncbi:MAG: DUF4340 domain-containing protein [Lachnospiraceae bacterium]